MLRTLRIRDLVIVEDLTVEFGSGLNLLTGETGAGKSIVVDALALVAGSRADRSLIRAGSPKAMVEALFELDGGGEFRTWAAERGIELADGGQLLVQRELPVSGNGRVRVNGSPATVNLLRELGSRTLELHGQHEQYTLLEAERQSILVDAFGGHDELLSATRRACGALQRAVERLAELRQRAENRAQRIGALTASVREIEAAEPRPGELDELALERRRLQNVERLSSLLEEVVLRTYESETAAAGMAAAAAERAEELADLDPELEGPAGQLRTAALELEDAGAAFRDYRDRCDFDPGRLEQVEARRVTIERLCLEYGADEGGLIERLAESREELRELGGLEEELGRLEAERLEAETQYAAAAGRLTKARQAAGGKLSAQVEAQLGSLALAKARFEVAFRPSRGGPSGAERAEFLLAANPGEPLCALGQAASGGELSRVMLALHMVTESAGSDRALVFDEVDAGVGGAVADAVGARLAALARRRQVLCVTHLPQVAAYADRHFRVRKRVRQGRTLADVEDLARESRVEELARMLAGKRPTETSRRHAVELLGAAGRTRPRPTRRRA